MKQTFTIGVFGIIKDEQDRVLLVLRNDYNFWNLPGGGLEKGESPWQGVIREVKEETGYDVEVVKLSGVYTELDQSEVMFAFECKIIKGEQTLNKEAKKIQYFSFDEIPKNTFQQHIERIEDFLKNKTNTTLKVQKTDPSINLILKGK
ncbi:NUDIX domain-containing protein [Patescibacteria group bacterium]|jgi:8-oxo-dGTP diphosphatase|nr:NUDIX domain-containing protein [Patescibacteria group bacterium]